MKKGRLMVSYCCVVAIAIQLLFPITGYSATSSVDDVGSGTPIPVKSTGDLLTPGEVNGITGVLRGIIHDHGTTGINNDGTTDLTDDKLTVPFDLAVGGKIDATGKVCDSTGCIGSSKWQDFNTPTGINYGTGNVGIGLDTTNGKRPLGKLHIKKTGTRPPLVVSKGTYTWDPNGSPYEIVVGDGNDYWGIGAGTDFSIGSHATPNLLNINAAGKVGIGTSTPAQQLEITGNFKLPNTTNANQNGIIYKDGTPFIHNFNYGNNGTVTTHGSNTFVGKDAGNFTMGSTAAYPWEASFNTFVGHRAGHSNTKGLSNTFIGQSAGLSNTSGFFNSFVGLRAGNQITTGYRNVFMGLNAGSFIADGTTPNQTTGNSVLLGVNTKVLADGDTNEIVIGYGAHGIGSNTVTLGNDSIVTTALKGNVGIGTITPASKLDVAGGIKFGTDTDTCDTTKAGTTRYNATDNKLELCNGTAWGEIGSGGSGGSGGSCFAITKDDIDSGRVQNHTANIESGSATLVNITGESGYLLGGNIEGNLISGVTVIVDGVTLPISAGFYEDEGTYDDSMFATLPALKYNNSLKIDYTATVSGNKVAGTAVTKKAGGSCSGGSGTASLPTCTNGQTLTYNATSSAWECGSGGGSGGAWVHSGQSVFSGNAPSSWTDLDLSSIVGAQRSLVMLKIKNTGSTASGLYNDTYFRPKGETMSVSDNGAFRAGVSATQAQPERIAYITVETNAAGVLEWKDKLAYSGYTIPTEVYIEGYIGAGSGGSGTASLPTCTNGQTLTYNATSSAWECGSSGGSSGGGWEEVDLNSTGEFDVACDYRGVLSNGTNPKNYVLYVAKEAIYLDVSTAGANYARVPKETKNQWQYSERGNASNIYGGPWTVYKIEKNCGGSGGGSGGAWVHSGQSVFSGNAPSSWTNLDLSSVVGATQSFVMIKIKNNGGTYTTQTHFRRNGETDEISNYRAFEAGVSSETVDTNEFAYITVETDTAGMVQWKDTNAASYTIPVELTVEGYIGAGSGGSGTASLPTCTNGQTLTYNATSSAWECGSGGGVAVIDTGREIITGARVSGNREWTKTINYTKPVVVNITGQYIVKRASTNNNGFMNSLIYIDDQLCSANQNSRVAAIAGNTLNASSHCTIHLPAGTHTIKHVSRFEGQLYDFTDNEWVTWVISAADGTSGGSGTASLPTCTNGQTLTYNATSSAWECSSGGTPSGFIGAFYLASCPTGWKAADGTNGTPDLRGQFLRGLNDFGTGARSDGNQDPQASRALGSYQADEIKSHNHPIGITSNPTGDFSFIQFAQGGDNQHLGSVREATAQSDAAGGSESRPKNVGAIYCIKAGSGGSGTASLPTCTNGQTLTYNATSSAWECGSGTLAKFVDGTNPVDAVYTTGNVGIGTTNPQVKLDVLGHLRVGVATHSSIGMRDDESPNGIKYIHANSNNIGFLSGASSWLTRWDNAGNQVNTGNITAPGFLYSSDRTLKKNIEALSNASDILKIGAKRFDWKKDGKHDIGVIAQEVEQYFPEAVKTGTDGLKAVDYPKLVAPLIGTLSYQEEKIKLLEDQNTKQGKRLERIEDKLSRLGY